MLPSLKWIALGSCVSFSDCSDAPAGMLQPSGEHPLPALHCIMSQRHVPYMLSLYTDLEDSG